MNEKSTVMRLARVVAALIIVGVGVAAFVLSFAALKGLAVMAHIPWDLAGLLPVVVDGTIILATLGWLVLANHPDRGYFLGMLAAGAAVSIAGNSLHAGMAGQVMPWWASALVAAIAPVSLLADTHGLAVLFRASQHDSPPESATQPVQDAPVTVAAGQRKSAGSRRDPAKVARAVAMRAEGKTYSEIAAALGVSERTAANYAPKPAGTPAPELAPERELHAIPKPIAPQARPVAAMLPIAVPVGGA